MLAKRHKARQVLLVVLPGNPPPWRFSERGLDESQVLIRNDSNIPIRACHDLNHEKHASRIAPTGELGLGGLLGLDQQSPNNLVVEIYSGVQKMIYWEDDGRPYPPGTLQIELPPVPEHMVSNVRLLSATDLTQLMPQFQGARPIFSINDNGQILTISIL
jgi:hypothetical protein